MPSWLRRTFGWFSVAALYCAVLGNPAAARDIATIKASGKLIVAVPTLNAPPFFFERDGELRGIDIDLAKGIAETLGVSVEFNRSGASFDEAVGLVVQDKADMAAAKISRTVKRGEVVLFSDPYITLQHAVLLNRLRFAEIAGDRPVTEVMQNYPGTVGVIAKSSFVDYARLNFPKAKIVEFPTWDDVIDAVTKGTVSAAYRDAFEARLVLKTKPDLSVNLRSVVIDDIQDSIAIAVGPTNYLFQNFLNLYLQNRNIKYTYDQILAVYGQYFK